MRVACLFAPLLVLSLNGTAAADEDSQRPYSLFQIVEMAEEANPSMAVFQARIAAARGALAASRAYPNPDAGVELGKGKATEQTGASYESERAFSLSQTLEWPGKRRSGARAAIAGVDVAAWEFQDFHLELVARVQEAFFDLVRAQQTRTVTRQNVTTAETLVQSAQLRVESGEAPALEQIRAEVELLKVTNELKRAENRVAVTRAVLNSLVGNRLARDFAIAEQPLGPLQSYSLSNLLENALARHPVILAREKALEAAEYALSRERQARFPDVTLGGAYTDELDKRSYAIGLSIPFPLLYQRQGEIAQARAEHDQAWAELAQARLDLGQRITQEYENYQIAVEQLRIFDQGLLKQAEEALRVAQFSYQQGESDLIELLDSQRVFRATVVEYYQAQFELQTARARLERMTGGLP